MIDPLKGLSELALARPIFHSEADFQHALAWKIHELWPTCSLRLEVKPPSFEDRIYVDICVRDETTRIAVELKYKTRRISTRVGDEVFNLLDQSAQDIGRYEFLKDVQRLEAIVSNGDADLGYAILLTNDSAYWKSSAGRKTLYEDFRLHDGRIITGEMNWRATDSKGDWTRKYRPVSIRGTYAARWNEYSAVGSGPYGKFRYLILRVAA